MLYIRISFLISLVIFAVLWFRFPNFQKFFKKSETYSFYEESKARIKDRNDNVPMTSMERYVVYVGRLFCLLFLFFNYLYPETWTFLSTLSEVLSGHVSWVGGLTMIKLANLCHLTRQIRYSRLQEREIHRLRAAAEALKKAATQAGTAAKKVATDAAEHADTGYKHADAFAKSDVARRTAQLIGGITGLAITAQVFDDGDSLGVWTRQTGEWASGEITRQHYVNSIRNTRLYCEDKKVLNKTIQDFLIKKLKEDPEEFYTRSEPYPEVVQMQKLHSTAWSKKTIPSRYKT